MRENRTKILLILISCFLGCAASAQSPTAPGQSPNLCDIDGGRWCTPCGHAGEVACPKLTDSGWLCCSGGVCVAVPLSGDCTSGTSGWCANYTEEQVGDSTVATCHDVP